MSEQFVTTTKHFRKLLAAGYLLIVLLVGGIICTWLGEWRDLELLERENREINRVRKETHDAYVGVVELSLLGESVLEWDDKDVAAYRRQRIAVAAARESPTGIGRMKRITGFRFRCPIASANTETQCLRSIFPHPK